MRIGPVSAAAAVFAFLFFCQHGTQARGQWLVPPSSSASSIPAAQLIQPEELNRILHTRNAERPLILQVGSHVMFAQAHIAGSEFAGAGSQDEGLQQLRSRVASLPRHSFVMLYCGCCPWNRCPNVGPAFKLMHDLGFTRVKVLYIADNFGDDWAGKGFPVESGR